MQRLRTIILLIMCLGMANASVAYATMPCCSPAAQESQSDSGELPCHDMVRVDSTDTAAICDGCQCTGCVKSSALITPAIARQHLPAMAVNETVAAFYSRLPEADFHPPRA